MRYQILTDVAILSSFHKLKMKLKKMKELAENKWIEFEVDIDSIQCFYLQNQSYHISTQKIIDIIFFKLFYNFYKYK